MLEAWQVIHTLSVFIDEIIVVQELVGYKKQNTFIQILLIQFH